MAVAHKVAISFGLVHIPVNLFTAIQDNDISFNQLHKADNSRIRYKKVCSHCGKEVQQSDIIKGFQFEKDQYVTITDEEIEKIKTEKDKTIQILHFANLDEINPVYYDKAYHVTPEKGGEKAFELLRDAMMQMQTVAIGRSVLGTNEKLLVIIPRADGILIQTLMYDDEVKAMPAVNKGKINDGEIKMAKQLIESMREPFEVAKYKDEFQEKLKDLISKKIGGKKVVGPQAPTPDKIINIMDALKASIDSQKKTKKAPAKSEPEKKPRKKA